MDTSPPSDNQFEANVIKVVWPPPNHPAFREALEVLGKQIRADVSAHLKQSQVDDQVHLSGISQRGDKLTISYVMTSADGRYIMKDQPGKRFAKRTLSGRMHLVNAMRTPPKIDPANHEDPIRAQCADGVQPRSLEEMAVEWAAIFERFKEKLVRDLNRAARSHPPTGVEEEDGVEGVIYKD